MSKPFFDEHDQPPPSFHFANNEIKAINTLYGIIMGITADQVVTDSEIYFLDLWLKDNEIYTQRFPLNVIKQRIGALLEDGIITQEERNDLYQTLIDMQGNDFQETGMAGGFSNASIFEEPAYLSFKDAMFCLTGQFVSGPRNKCENTIKRFGGIPAKNITQELNYLIVGTIGSRDWIASGHGRKIEKAMHYKQKGFPIVIMSEESLLKFVAL
jgi:NAD-dependent DNA ligase